MKTSFHAVALSAAAATACALVATLAVLAVSRPPVLLSTSSASTSPTSDPGVFAGGDAIVSKRPDLALISVGVDSKQGTASAAQQDLATKAGKLIAKAKALGIADKDITTSGYSVNANYVAGGSVDGYVASEQLGLKWHNVDTVGKTLDALVQEGGATQIGVGFTLADPKAAQSEARALAIADARSRAQAMANAAGVKLGRVVRVSDVGFSGYPSAYYPIKGGAAASTTTTQVPIGQLDVQVSVEVDFAIDG
ncbi:MAG TPA: SIMPL domain-containing protein [Candidatus Dormibacteraeota bacterium]|nr:SIMPL domain-containing protein [Candidatus Dormibacteraeota bacterium]